MQQIVQRTIINLTCYCMPKINCFFTKLKGSHYHECKLSKLEIDLIFMFGRAYIKIWMKIVVISSWGLYFILEHFYHKQKGHQKVLFHCLSWSYCHIQQSFGNVERNLVFNPLGCYFDSSTCHILFRILWVQKFPVKETEYDSYMKARDYSKKDRT